MSSTKHSSGQGIVLRKYKLKDSNISLSIFSKHSGKLHMFAYGVRNITSRRLSHLESGNYIAFTYRSNSEKYYVNETELIYAYSSIKENPAKLTKTYAVLKLLDKILPENEAEGDVFDMTLEYFKKLNNYVDKDRLSNMPDQEEFMTSILVQLGYVDKETTQQNTFDLSDFAKNNIGISI